MIAPYPCTEATRNSELGAWLLHPAFSAFPATVTFPPVLTRPFIAAIALVTLACGGKPANPTPEPRTAEREPVRPLITIPFSGQSLAVTPLTLVVSDEAMAGVPPLDNRSATLAWADSLVAAALLGRSPEVKWVLPAELRKLARRAPTLAPDPDRMGQSLLRGTKVEDVPDPLRTNLRSIMALVGGRYALVPAALAFLREPNDGPVRAELSLALVDTRTGKVTWRSLTWGTGATPERALIAALNTVLPVGLGLR